MKLTFYRALVAWAERNTHRPGAQAWLTWAEKRLPQMEMEEVE